MALIAIMSFFFLAFTALAVFFILGVPFLIWLGKVLCVLVGGSFEWAASAFEKTRTEAAVERKVEAGMTPDEAREAVEREREERAHQETSLAHIALVSAAFMLVIALVGVADYLFGPRLEPSSQTSIEIKPMIPEVGMDESELEDTSLGECSCVWHARSAIGSDGTVLDVDYVYVWEASNGSHDPMLKVYVRDGVAVVVERCNVDVYWRDFERYPNRFAHRPEGYVPDGVPGQGAAQEVVEEADESPEETVQGSTSSTGDSTAVSESSKAPADTYEGNPSASFDPLDYDSAEEYAEDAEGWFRDHGSADPYGDALEYWEDNGP